MYENNKKYIFNTYIKYISFVVHLSGTGVGGNILVLSVSSVQKNTLFTSVFF